MWFWLSCIMLDWFKLYLTDGVYCTRRQLQMRPNITGEVPQVSILELFVFNLICSPQIVNYYNIILALLQHLCLKIILSLTIKFFWGTNFIFFIRCISKNSKLAQISPFFCLQNVKSDKGNYLDSHFGDHKKIQKTSYHFGLNDVKFKSKSTNSSLSVAHIVVMVLVQKKKSKINLASAAARVLTNTKKMDHIGPKRSIVCAYHESPLKPKMCISCQPLWNQEWKHSCWRALNINPKYYLIGYFSIMF